MSFEIGNIYWFPVPIQLLFSSYETHNDFTNFYDKLFFFIWICWSLSIWREFERRTARSIKKINSFWHVLRKWTLFDKHTFQSQFHVIDFYSNISMNIYHFVLCFVFLSFNNLTNFFSSYQRSETSSWTSCTISCIFIRLFRKATSTSKIVVNVAAWNENWC